MGESEKVKRPEYDGRQVIFEHNGKILTGFRESMLNGQLRAATVELSILFSNISPWIGLEHRQQIREELMLIKKKIVNLQAVQAQRDQVNSQIQGILAMEIENRLTGLYDHILSSSSHYWLPDGSVEETLTYEGLLKDMGMG